MYHALTLTASRIICSFLLNKIFYYFYKQLLIKYLLNCLFWVFIGNLLEVSKRFNG